MSMPATYNIDIFYGNTLNLSFTLTDSMAAAINLSTKTVEFIVRKNLTVLETYGVGTGLTITGPGFNVVNLSKVIDITPGPYTYDLKVTTSPSDIRTYLSGRFYVRKDT